MILTIFILILIQSGHFVFKDSSLCRFITIPDEAVVFFTKFQT